MKTHSLGTSLLLIFFSDVLLWLLLFLMLMLFTVGVGTVYVIVVSTDVVVASSGDDQLTEKNVHHCFDQFKDET